MSKVLAFALAAAAVVYIVVIRLAVFLGALCACLLFGAAIWDYLSGCFQTFRLPSWVRNLRAHKAA